MSQRSERLTEVLDEFEPALERLHDVYHIPVLVTLLAFMLWVRVRNWKNFVVDGQVLFTANDPWYHYRMVQYTVEHFPATMPYDPWTHFPVGTSVGTFGTLYDQLVALAALVIGLGSPTEKQVALTLLFAPAVIGTLTAIPVYFIGARFGDRLGGIVAVLVLALSPGAFLFRTTVGFSDHHAAEALFMAISVALVLRAFHVAERDKPIWDLIETREFEPLRPTLFWSALAGLAIGLYLWVWPPGVFLVGVFGAALAVALALQYVRGVSPDHVAIVGVVMNVIAGLLALVPLNVYGFSPTDYSLAQPLLAFAVAVAVLFIAAAARYWDHLDQPRLYYPGALLAIGLVGVGAVALLAPHVLNFFVDQLLRVVGLGATVTSQTVAEARPPRQPPLVFLTGSYGLAIYTAFAGFALLAYHALTDDEPRAEHVFVVVWFVFLLLMTFTQVRFDYYLVLAVSALNAAFVAAIVRFVDLDDLRDVSNVELYQVLAVLTVVLLIVMPLALTPLNVVKLTSDPYTQPGGVTNWDGTLAWVQGNTPELGAYGDGTPSDYLDYYGTYERVEDFDYKEGAYGVLAWWDYGHWITVLGHRIPVANPFQQNAHDAANVLLAPNESIAIGLMVNDQDEETRYVIIDYPLGVAGTSKFTAPTAWEELYGITSADVETTLFVPTRGGGLQRAFTFHDQRSYESLRVRLYQFHGSRAEPQPFVIDYTSRRLPSGATIALPPEDGQPIKRFDNMSAARAFVERDGSSQIGGLLSIPSEPVPALQHFRLVYASDVVGQMPAGQREAWVKVFERVPGATVIGQGPPNTTVTATVTMRTKHGTFNYTQQATTNAEGEFRMVLPYSTTGYDEWGVEASYTNVSVRATGPYTFTTPKVSNDTAYVVRYKATVPVPEAKVIGEDDSPIRVTLERTVVAVPGGAQTGGNATDGAGNSTGNATDGDTSGGNMTDGNTTDGGGNAGGNGTDADGASNGTGTNGTSQSMLAPPTTRASARS